MNKAEIGNKAELQACRFLQTQGLDILQQNYKALPYGEIDIVALDKGVLVFVEVKYRKSKNFGTAEAMVGQSKQQKIIMAAQMFLQQNEKYSNHECRFDVVAINGSDLNWIKAAFDLV